MLRRDAPDHRTFIGSGRVADLTSLALTTGAQVVVFNEELAPRMAGAGLTLGTDRFAQVSFEWTGNLDAPKTLNRYAVGVEALLGNMFPVRAGFVKDEFLDTRWWSAGVGVVQGRVGIDVGYRQSLDSGSARTISVSLKSYFTE